ncbi:MAG TPA: DUF5131 family protein [Terriglobia bacterium]|nr:DUF5131 family protein [Terriglobia bacterium]
MSTTKIEWVRNADGTQGETINPFRARNKATGAVGHFCEKVGPGCKNCYASRLQSRFGLFPFLAENRDKVELFLDESKLQKVLRRRKPTTWFWADMTDMFWDGYPDEWRDRCFAVMALTPQHTHVILTKRAGPLREWSLRLQHIADNWAPKTKTGQFSPADVLNLRWMHWTYGRGPAFPYHPWPLPNVWLGVSVEDQATADERIPLLLRTPAALRFVSYEPALGPVDFSLWLTCIYCRGNGLSARDDSDSCSGSHIDWLIVGGESGPDARDCNVIWLSSVIQQCQDAGIPCFIKQLGSRPYSPVSCFSSMTGESTDSRACLGLRNKKGANPSEWPEYLRVRQMPERTA